ncbi:MAG: DNA repair protein RecO [Sphingobacteriia bacterium]|nr:DNA repair protein RecO [Sphingobacteriia bacterium]NCC38775.1 DNA repair protein RecO [Gammaproteobacteria bacterium]
MSELTRGELRQAFVLHRRDHGNTSLLVELFAVGRGRFPAIAKGARRSRDPASALLQPFQPLWVGVLGRGEVRTLSRVEAAGMALALRGHALFCGFYLNELLTRLLGRDDPQDPVFAFYHAALSALADGRGLDQVLRRFELQLLAELGYAPVLDLDTRQGEAVVAQGWYQVEPGEGVRRVSAGSAPDLFSGETLLALARGEPPSSGHQVREARALLRRLLAPHLGGRPMRSRELFRQGARAAPSGPVASPGATIPHLTSNECVSVNRSLQQ